MDYNPHDVFLRFKNNLRRIPVPADKFKIYTVALFFLYVAISLISSQIFDDATYVQHAQWYYYFDISPLYYWVQGLYYLSILISGYLPVILFGQLGIHSVLLEQLFVKIPFIVAIFLTSFMVRRMLIDHGLAISHANMASLIVLANPLSIYVVGVHGNPTVIEVLFSLASVYLLMRGKGLLSGISLGVAVSTYLFPVFFFIPMLVYLVRNKSKLSLISFVLSSVITSSIGFFSPYFLKFLVGSLPSSGLITSPGNLAASQLPLYSLFEFLGLIGHPNLIPYSVYETIFYVSMALISIYTIAVVFKKANMQGLVESLLLISLCFVIFNFAPGPQYFFVFVPLIIMEMFLSEKYWYSVAMEIQGVLVFLSLVTWGSQDLLGFFSNTYPHLLVFYQNFPYRVYEVFATFLGLSSIILFLSVLSNSVVSKPRKSLIPKTVKSEFDNTNEDSKSNEKQTFVRTFSAFVILVIVAYVVVSPGLPEAPSSMVLMSEINTFSYLPDHSNYNASAHTLNLEYPNPYFFKLINKNIRSRLYVTFSYKSKITTILENFALNKTVSLISGERMNSTFILPYEVSNLSFSFMTYYYTFADGKFSMEPNHNAKNLTTPIKESYSYYILNSYNTNGAAFWNVTVSGPVKPGVYNISISSYSNSLVIGTHGFDGSNTMPVSMNGNNVTNQYLSSFVTGYPILFENITVNGLIEHSNFNNVSVPLDLLVGNNDVKIGNLDYNLSLQISETLSLSSVSFHQFLYYNPLNLIIGSLGFGFWLIVSIEWFRKIVLT